MVAKPNALIIRKNWCLIVLLTHNRKNRNDVKIGIQNFGDLILFLFLYLQQ